jgi:hypothetical protein
MAYIPVPISSIAQKLTIKIREAERVSEVVPVPFYDTSKYGYKRAKM